MMRMKGNYMSCYFTLNGVDETAILRGINKDYRLHRQLGYTMDVAYVLINIMLS